MSSMDGLEPRAEGIARGCDASSPRRSPLTVLVVGAAIVVILVAAFLAGHRLASVWSALAIVAWMFVAGAAQASSD